MGCYRNVPWGAIMPLSKKRMRERKRQDRAVKPKSNLLPQETASMGVKPKQETLDSLRKMIAGYAIIGTPFIDDIGEFVDSASEEGMQSAIPTYNPAIHRAGDKVLIKPPYGKKMIETVIPDIDAEGNAIYEE